MKMGSTGEPKPMLETMTETSKCGALRETPGRTTVRPFPSDVSHLLSLSHMKFIRQENSSRACSTDPDQGLPLWKRSLDIFCILLARSEERRVGKECRS